MKTAIMLSGGLDSTLALMIADKQGLDAIGVYVDLGQPYNKKEQAVVRRLAKSYDVRQITCKVVSQENGNVPTIEDQVIDGRNMTLVTIGANFGDRVWLCALDGEMHDYMPDKNEKFFSRATTALSQAYGREIRVETPFKDLTKAELIAKAIEMGVPIKDIKATSTCYHESLKRCGECSACVKRYIAFSLNKIKERYSSDPLESDYAKEYRQKLKLAWETQDFSHYSQKRILESFKVFQICSTIPLFGKTEPRAYRTTPKAEIRYFEQKNAIPRVLHTAWVGIHNERSAEMAEITHRTFKQFNDGYEIIHWTEDNIEQLDLSDLKTNWSELRTLLSVVPAVFKVDVYRTIIGYVHGGIYLDVDFTIQGSFESMLWGRSIVMGLQQEDQQIERLGFGAGGGFFACKPKTLFMERLFEIQLKALKDLNMESYDDYMQGVGITAWNQALEEAIEFGEDITILPREIMYPYGYWEQESPREYKSTLMIHHWNHSGLGLERMKRSQIWK